MNRVLSDEDIAKHFAEGGDAMEFARAIEAAVIAAQQDASAEQAVPDERTPAAVWMDLIHVMELDNGGYFPFTVSDYRRAAPDLRRLIASGYFRGDAADIDGDYWQMAAGGDDKYAHFSVPFATLDKVLNEVFDRPASSEQAQQPPASIADPLPGTWEQSDFQGGYADVMDAQAAEKAQQPASAPSEVERQYKDGVHIGSGLPRENCPCGLCKKYPAQADAPKGEPVAWVHGDTLLQMHEDQRDCLVQNVAYLTCRKTNEAAVPLYLHPSDFPLDAAAIRNAALEQAVQEIRQTFPLAMCRGAAGPIIRAIEALKTDQQEQK